MAKKRAANVQITDPRIIEAVRAGNIDGDIYADGECWVSSVQECPMFEEISTTEVAHHAV